jgi:general secretion pathway protein D
MKPRSLSAPLLALMFAGCSTAPVAPPSAGHIEAPAQAAPAARANIPQPVQNTVTLPKPKAAAKVETYSVVVNNVRVHDLLFALARDAKINVDVHPGLSGLVTLNAIDQTLPQLLGRISKQVDMRWEMDGPNLAVMPDKPFLRTYQIDFLNMSRTVKSAIATSTQIASAQTGASGSSAPQSGSTGNTATTTITSDTKNDLMESLISNVTDMLKEEDRLRYRQAIETEAGIHASTFGSGRISSDFTTGKTVETPAQGKTETSGPGIGASGSGNQAVDSRAQAKQRVGEYEPAVSVFANKESGVLFVRATNRQHEKVQQFIDQVMQTAKRQVLIEATIVEVKLSKNYQQGIDWQYFNQGNAWRAFGQGSTTRTFRVNPTTGAFEATTNVSTLPSAVGNTLFSAAFKRGDFLTAIKLLETFGTLKVLSSPKLTVMNNQTATLKVADSRVYFEVKADTQTAGSGGIVTTTVTTTPRSISVGFLMNVTPQISESEDVTLNVRPTITRILGYVNDPNPLLAAAGQVNRVPEVQTREMESIIKIADGQVAVMGGLMQDEMNNTDDIVPAIGRIPILGDLFSHRNDTSTKTELVVFLRPVVVKDASIEGDFASFRDQLPDKGFFDNNSGRGKYNANGGKQ